MSRFRAQYFFACVLGCEILLGSSAAFAQPITYRKVVDTNTPIPGGTGTFTSLDHHPSVRAGDVAFHAEGSGGQSGIFAEIGGTVGLVADTATPIPGGTGSFTAFGRTPPGPIVGFVSFDGANVVFRGLGSSAQDGIYTNQGGTLRAVADINTPIPAGTGNFAGFRFDPSIDSGNIAFGGSDTAASSLLGAYTEVGGVLSVVVDATTSIPGIGTLSGVDVVSMDGTDMAFRAFAPAYIGLITHIGGVFDVVMDVNTPIPGGSGNFTVFGAATLDAGDTVFLGGTAPLLTGVYTDLGGTLRVVADLNTQVPLGTGNFTDFFFGPVAAIDNGNVAFMGARFSTFGMYAEMQGSLMKVVDETDLLGVEAPVSLDGGSEALAGNQAAFWATFADGSEAIYVATIALDVCGNGIPEIGEECDDQGETADCDSNCTFAVCGDGTLNASAGETCDDGNTINGDGCQSNCRLPGCGDGVVDPGEECDDGNTINDDGCRNICTLPSCGDAVVDPSEECDDGNTIDGDACRNNCTAPRCGDGIVDFGFGEQCDDGNTNNADFCRDNCTVIRCGDGVLDAGEQCDDGNAINTDGCRNKCTLPGCGDGIVDAGEQCDDGNGVDGDGCSSICQAEVTGGTVPTVSQWGLMIMCLLLAVGGKVHFRRHQSLRERA